VAFNATLYQVTAAIGQANFRCSACRLYFASSTKRKTTMKKQTVQFVVAAMALFFSITAQADSIISSEVIGQGRPMILIHGMSCSADVWKDVVAHYRTTYQMHLITLKGFGNDASFSSDHILQQVRDELIAYIKENNLQNTILMGHSMGGFLSLWIASTAPDLVSKVISVDGIPYFPVLQMPGITAESAKEMVKQMSAGMNSMTEEQYRLQQQMMIAGMIATEEKRAAVVEMGLKSNRAVTGQAYGEMFTTDIRPEMHKIKVPVLVLGAWAAYEQYGSTKDLVEASFKAQVKDIPNVQVRVADKAFHFIFYDEPAWFYQQVDTFIGSNSL
jgi:pimeloyl-ACP methyl ester carboxylesterase